MVSAITKTLLSAYKDLEEQCKILDGLMTACAVKSANRDIYKTADKLFAYRNEKIALINVKVIVDQTLEKMTRKASLVDKYITHEAFPCRHSMETAEKQLEEFNTLLFQEYTPAKLFDIISDSKFIMKIYRHYSKQEQAVKGGQGAK